MAGKRGLVMGVANDRSLAWGIAAACAAQGAELAFTYQGEALERRVRPLAAGVGSTLLAPCDVADDASIDAAFATIERQWGGLDFLVHAIGFADKNFLRGRYVDTPREAFLQALDISCFSFTAVARRAAAMMRPGGSLLTLSYLGAERVVPHYNVMGVAKAALEASVRYLAPISARTGCGSTPSVPARSARWRPAASAISATSCAGTSTTPRWTATSPSRTWAARRSTCCPTWPPASPARCIMSIAAITWSA